MALLHSQSSAPLQSLPSLCPQRGPALVDWPRPSARPGSSLPSGPVLPGLAPPPPRRLVRLPLSRPGPTAEGAGRSGGAALGSGREIRRGVTGKLVRVPGVSPCGYPASAGRCPGSFPPSGLQGPPSPCFCSGPPWSHRRRLGGESAGAGKRSDGRGRPRAGRLGRASPPETRSPPAGHAEGREELRGSSRPGLLSERRLCGRRGLARGEQGGRAGSAAREVPSCKFARPEA